MVVKIIHCPTWKSYVGKVASYAAAIRDRYTTDPIIQTGSRGQFDVLVNDQLVVSRKGGLLALLTRKPWPSHEAVLEAMESFVE